MSVKSIYKKHHQSGLSLIGVLIGFAIAGIISVLMMRVNEMGVKKVKRLEAKDDKRTFLKSLTMVHIPVPEVCLKNFGPAGLNTVTDMTIANNLTDLWKENDAKLISVGDIIPGNNYTLEKLTFGPFTASGVGSSDGICPLVLQFKIISNAKGQKSFGGEIIEDTINFGCSVDLLTVGTPLTSCLPASSGSDDSIWAISIDSGTTFLNWDSFTGAGNAIIGDPSADPSADDLAVINLNYSGVSSETHPVSANAISHGMKVNNLGVLNWDDTFGIASNSTTNCTDIFYDSGDPTVNKVLSFCPYLTQFGLYQSLVANTRHELRFPGAIHLESVTDVPNKKSIDFENFADANRIKLSLNRLTLDPIASSYTKNNLAGASMYFERPTDTERFSLFMFDSTHSPSHTMPSIFNQERMRIENTKNNVRFGDYSSLFDATSTYNFAIGERLIFRNTTGSLMMGQNNALAHTSGSMILGFINAIKGENAGNPANGSLIIGRDNEMSAPAAASGAASESFIYGGSSISYGKNVMATGFNHYMGSATYFSLAAGEGHRVFNHNEFAFGSFGKSVSSTEEESVLHVGSGESATEQFNHFMLNRDGQIELRRGPYSHFTQNPATVSDRMVLVPAQNLTDPVGKFSWITNNMKVLCTTLPCVAYKEDTADNQYGFSAIGLNDIEGSVNIYAGSIAGPPRSALPIPYVIPNSFLNPVSAGGMLIASVKQTETEFYTIFIGGANDGITDLTATGIIYSAVPLNPPSDRKLKKNIKNLSAEKSEGILKLQGKSFEYLNRPGKKVLGFIAQEVQKYFPELVQIQENGNLALNYEGLLAPLWKSAQILLEEIIAAEKELKSIWTKFQKLRDEELKLIQENEKILLEICQLPGHQKFCQ